MLPEKRMGEALTCVLPEKAIKGKGLERSFQQAIPREVYETLEREMREIDTE